MPFGGDDRLALTEEPALEPEIPIRDPHHRFWDLRPGRIPYQRYLLHELAAGASGLYGQGKAAAAILGHANLNLRGIGMPRTGFDWHARSKPVGSEELAESMEPFSPTASRSRPQTVKVRN